MGFSQIVTGLEKCAMIITNCNSTFVFCHLGLPYGFIKLSKRSIFVSDSYLNGSVFTAVKRMQSSKQSM